MRVIVNHHHFKLIISSEALPLQKRAVVRVISKESGGDGSVVNLAPVQLQLAPCRVGQWWWWWQSGVPEGSFASRHVREMVCTHVSSRAASACTLPSRAVVVMSVMCFKLNICCGVASHPTKC